MKQIFIVYLSAALAMISADAVHGGENRVMDETETLEMIRTKAEADGIVRVIVTIAEPDGSAENSRGIESTKLLMQNALPMDDAPLVEPIEGQPMVVMEVSPRGLEWLADAPMVQDIQLDGLTGIPPIEDDAQGGAPEGDGNGDDASNSGGGSNDLSAPQSD